MNYDERMCGLHIKNIGSSMMLAEARVWIKDYDVTRTKTDLDQDPLSYAMEDKDRLTKHRYTQPKKLSDE